MGENKAICQLFVQRICYQTPECHPSCKKAQLCETGLAGVGDAEGGKGAGGVTLEQMDKLHGTK